MSKLEKILLNKKSCKSVWFMRQAGRYLPEFRKIRSENTNFIQLCLDSELSSEITLQPIKRFNLDAAIIFSDILMVPYALGQDVSFIKDEGPILSKFNIETFFKNSEKSFLTKLSPIYKAIEITRKKLNKEKSLISFIGAPWTLIVYMFNLKKDKNNLSFKELENNKSVIEKMLDDTWAGLIPEKDISRYCLTPNAKIVDFCKKKEIPNICFPKGLKEKYEDFNKIVKPNGINLDSQVDPFWAKNKLGNVVIQGGLSPDVLLKTDEQIFKAATKYIKTFKDIPYIFNLGHGLLPETDPDKVKKLVNFYRYY